MPPKHGHGGGGGHKAEHSTGTSYASGNSSDDRGFDFNSIASLAQSHSGGTADSGMLSNALSMISGKQSQLSSESVDENHLVNAHQSFFGGGSSSGGEATTSGMGGAAAMQALKLFNSGTSAGESNESGDMKQQFMGMAMGQAAKLFEQQQSAGKVSSDSSKESVMQEAGEQALKMYMSSEMGGSSSGGLMSLASKFM